MGEEFICSFDKEDFLWRDEGVGDVCFGLLIIVRVLSFDFFFVFC